MKKVFLILLLLISSLPYKIVFSQTLKSAKLEELLVPVYDQQDSTKILFKRIEYRIRCTFDDTLKENEALDINNWQVTGKDIQLQVERIAWAKNFKPERAHIVGQFKDEDRLSVSFLGGPPILVDVTSATVGETKFGFGKGQALEFNAQRIANQDAIYAFDYDVKVKIMEHNVAIPSGRFWFRSLSFNISSEGTFASDDQARNGTQTKIGAFANPFFFVNGLVYRGALSGAFLIETEMNNAKNELIDITNRSFVIGGELEVPLTNYPIYKLHTKTGYVRLAMPLTLSLDYIFPGDQKSNTNVPQHEARLDFKSRYELAFSPYLIVQGEWHASKLYDTLAGVDDTPTFYSIAFAQDLDAVKKVLGFLKFILGPEEEIRGKNFIFFRISNGRKAPNFVDIDQKTFGFGTFF